VKRLFLIVLLTTIILTGCKNPESNLNNIFNPKEVKIGDEVAKMKVISLETGDDGPNYSVSVTFEGNKTLYGRFVQYENHDFLDNAISFEVDEAKSDKLPLLSYDERNIWFVFRNREEAINLFNEYENDNLTIEISDYTINYAPTEVVNESTLVRVIDGVKNANTGVAIYRNEEYGISLEYPASWEPNNSYTPARYEGSEGFFQITAVAAQSNIDEVVELEVNHKLAPYGSNPIIESSLISGQEARFVIPSTNQSTQNQQSVLVVTYPNPRVINGSSYNYFQLWADMSSIREIGEAIKFLDVE